MPTCTHTQSEEKAAMVDAGTKVQIPISRRAHSRPPSAPERYGSLPAPQSTHTEAPAAAAYVPAPQSMHASELDAPVAELYVPAEVRPSDQSQGGKAQPQGHARGSWLRGSRNREINVSINKGIMDTQDGHGLPREG